MDPRVYIAEDVDRILGLLYAVLPDFVRYPMVVDDICCVWRQVSNTLANRQPESCIFTGKGWDGCYNRGTRVREMLEAMGRETVL